MEDLLYSWSFSSKKDRPLMWYIIVLSISMGLVIWWFLSTQYWMSFVILILLWLIFYVDNNSNDIVEVQITKLWIKVENSFYAFSNISSYSLIYEWENAVLLRLKIAKKIWLQNIDIQIDNTIVLDLQNILSNFIEENEKEELSFWEKIFRLLKI